MRGVKIESGGWTFAFLTICNNSIDGQSLFCQTLVDRWDQYGLVCFLDD